MSRFSPKTYQIYQYDNTDLSQISYYYNCFTLLEKPIERNVYKVSLAQMLHYMFDFGIGYNSKCVTTLTTQQQFTVGRYVNRHATQSPLRPATVADLKKKILNVVEALVKRSIRHKGNLIAKSNNIFPTYLFTLDNTLDALKLKQITGHDYVEMSDFENFAYISNSSPYVMPKYRTGYVPISAVRCVPNHSHDTHSKINRTISYSWSLGIFPKGHSSWAGHMFNISCSSAGGWTDNTLGQVMGLNFADSSSETGNTYQDCVATLHCSWDKPSGVSCYENEEKDPVNTVSTTDGSKLSIRYFGRRYRLFKKVS